MVLGWRHPPVVCGGSRLVGGEPERNADVNANTKSDRASRSESYSYTSAAARGRGGCVAEPSCLAGAEPDCGANAGPCPRGNACRGRCE